MIVLASNNDVNKIIKGTQKTFIFLHTPMCGTCKLARKYLEVIEYMEDTPSLYDIDINVLGNSCIVEWGIQSVPCLAIVKDGQLVNKMFAFESVTKIYEFIRNN
ncbi:MULTISPECIES: thioredoxin family protein [Bacillaceae]|uniref:Thioredoxin family protein n=1 Tax=Evansella alkalicola TaxID=745819 RepID=A0ABS6JZ82_9BACI|nr:MULTISPECIES: thioredoxin family protein [Bacillaceae]MBU9723893.1 thioredoxin family protein [Bacillus alkalicola]